MRVTHTLQAITNYEPSRKGLIGGTILFDFISSIPRKRKLEPEKLGFLGGCPAWYIAINI